MICIRGQKQPPFQSTLPAWGETCAAAGRVPLRFISIHSPRMGRDHILSPHERYEGISIHSPRMGRDNICIIWSCFFVRFQSTLPAWGETFIDRMHEPDDSFQSTLPAWGETTFDPPIIITERFQSTLPAWGETTIIQQCCFQKSHFNPLSPHGERRRPSSSRTLLSLFQSTLPAWGETALLSRLC